MAVSMDIWRLIHLLLHSDTQIQTDLVPDMCNFSLPSLLHQASHFKREKSTLRGVMYPGQVLRPAVYSGPLGTCRTGPALFACYCERGFPMDQMLLSSNPAVSAHCELVFNEHHGR